MDHRWSGWPGAWCLDCGAEDIRELCLAGACSVKHEWGVAGNEPTPIPPICDNKPCPEPGSNRCNPYVKKSV